MTKEEEKRLVQTLDAGASKYYVYALCKSDGTPFYIGKGAGARVLNHKDAAEQARESIEADDTLTEEEKNEKISRLTDKLRTILSENESLQMVIIKWGLTESESFMCESALINLLAFAEGKTIIGLTNIVNGHASKAEKASVSDVKTKARTLSQFLQECAISQKDVSEVRDGVVCIKINGFYPRCLNEDGTPDMEKVKESVRGAWKIHWSRRDKIKYIFALYCGRVVGIFHVTSPGRELGAACRNGAPDYPRFPAAIREAEKLCCAFDSLSEARRCLSLEDFQKVDAFLENVVRGKQSGVTKEDIFEDLQTRVYFSVDDDIPDHLKVYMNSIITVDGSPKYFNSQNPIRYING